MSDSDLKRLAMGQVASTMNPLSSAVGVNPVGVGLTVFTTVLALAYFITLLVRLKSKNKNQSNFKYNTVWFCTFVLFCILILNTYFATIPGGLLNILVLTLIFVVLFTALD